MLKGIIEGRKCSLCDVMAAVIHGMVKKERKKKKSIDIFITRVF